MKTTSLIPKLSGLLVRLTFVTAISFISISCTSQTVWEASEVKAGESIFICEKYGNRIFIQNSNYVDPMKTRTEYNWDWLEYSYVSMISHDLFLEAFKESFTDSRLTQLAKTNDYILIIFNVDEKGQILGVYFGLREETTILPEEMEILEQELLSSVEFVVIGKKVEDLIFHRVLLKVYFSEIQDGEIRSVRYSVNLKNRY
ncbi:MAG: hypothetical protein R6U04_02905 [Bacteroidales bacterium]